MKQKNEQIKLRVSETLVDAIKHFEGLRLDAYKCPGNKWTIGYGHTYGVRPGDRITQQYAEDILRTDIYYAEKQVLELNVCRQQGELDALVSFVFNFGILRLEKSTLLKVIRRREPADVIMKEWRRWNKAGGKVMKGLVTRRQWEMLRFFEDTPYVLY